MNNAVNVLPRPDDGLDLAAEIAALAPWSQNLILPDGTPTAPDVSGGDHASTLWEQFRDFLPADLSGCTVLDIGCNAGFFAIELARRGAHVTAVDSSAHFLRQAHWAIGRHGFAERVELFRGQVYDLARWPGRHDIVLLLGQLHRLRYPLLMLDIASRLAQRLLVLQVPTVREPRAEPPPDDLPHDAREWLADTAGWPRLTFVEKAFAGDPATWWLPNPAAVEAMVRSTGFEVVSRPGPDIHLCQPRKQERAQPRWTDPAFLAATSAVPSGLIRFIDPSETAPPGISPLAMMNNNGGS